MIRLAGRDVRSTLEELLDPAITALLVIDMQVGGVSAGGALGESGHDLSNMPAVRAACSAAIAAAREAGVPIVHVRVANLPGGASSPPAWLRALQNQSNGRSIDLNRLSVEGAPDGEFSPECMPIAGEPVITKRRPSAFYGTDVAMLLRAQAIESVAVVGISTGGCVEATLRDATHNDFYAVLLEDAVGAYDLPVHEAALTVMRARHDVTTVSQAAAVWSASGRRQHGERHRAGVTQ